ncbi:glycosyltransferase family 39 protein [Candidatus Kaiserbacteria bacterium]|nr:glycosyltransferase family 39 protein [Candidatus Kaiserbacteria bacterium]
MALLRKIEQLIRAEPVLFALLALAFLLRVAGVGYGLPLTVVNDEYPFTYAALQMLDARTLIPALNPEAFANILPYPPYLSYVLVLPFAGIIGVKMLLWNGASDLFTAYLLSDLSAFFVTARLIHVVLGTVSVYLVYRIAEALFRSKVAATAAGFLIATSILHQALSMVGRNWLPISFVFLLVLFILTRDIRKERRYLYAFVAAGVGMGISSISLLALPMIGLYYLYFDVKNSKQIIHDVPPMFLGVFAFVILALIPGFLWQGGNAFLGATTLFEGKSLVGLIAAPWSALSLTLFSEPVFTVFFLIGAAFLVARERQVFFFVLGFFFLYVAVFYTFFRFDARFLLPLLPLYALLGGYIISRLWNRSTALLMCIVLLVPLAASARLAYLSFQGDTREHAREWVLENLGPNDRVLVYSSSLHIPTQAKAVEELRSIDPSALRKIDEADERLNRGDVPHALNNLTSLIETPFMQNLPAYAQEKKYTHIVLEPRSLEGTAETADVIATLRQDAVVAAHFSGIGAKTSVWESAFLEPLPALFADKRLGPEIVIYRLADQ